MNRAQKKLKLLSLFGSIRGVARQYDGDPRLPHPVDETRLRYYLTPRCKHYDPAVEKLIELALAEGPPVIDWAAVRQRFNERYPPPSGRTAFVKQYPMYSRNFIDRIMNADPKNLRNPRVKFFLKLFGNG